MKFNFLRCRSRDDSGIILLVVLWMMVILSLLAIGVGRRTGIDLALTKYAVGKLKADNLAWAGLMYAVAQIKKDSADTVSGAFDTSYQCGIALGENQTPEGIFKNIPVGDGHFDVGFIVRNPESGVKEMHYGLQDEDGKININTLTQNNYKVLSYLISLSGFEEPVAEAVAAAAVDWTDADSFVLNSSSATENTEYPYRCKNFPFESIEELLVVKGMTPEIFSKIKNYITVFPQDVSVLVVNINTAPEMVIRALGRSIAGAATGTEMGDADSMAANIIAYRRGEDAKEYTADDRRIDNALESLTNPKERTIFLSLAGSIRPIISNYLRIHVTGVDQISGVDSSIEAVVYRDDLSVVSWSRD